MKRLIRVSSDKMSRKYLGEQPKYNVYCSYSHNKAIMTPYLSSTVSLEVEGEEENIQRYIEYLKSEGFKIK